MEALKIKWSKLLRLGKRVRVLATTYEDINTELRKKYVEKYLVNLKDVEVMGLEELCWALKVDYNWRSPRDTVNKVIQSLSNQNVTTLLLIDEVWPCSNTMQVPDWRNLAVKENVVWLLGLTPIAHSASSTEVLPPENSSVLTRHLVHKQRNCPQIRNIIKTNRLFNIFFKH